MLRFLLFCFFSFVVSFDVALANPDEGNKENVPYIKARTNTVSQEKDEKLSREAPTPLKRTRDDFEKGSLPLAELSNTSYPAQLAVPLPKPSSPTKREKDYWLEARKRFVLEQHPNGQKKRKVLSSPKAKEILKAKDDGSFFSRKVTFQERTVLQADFLFGLDSVVLSDTEKWETNLQRMQRGASPIAYKGIISDDQRDKVSQREILKLQNRYRIDMQHVTQRESRQGEDPEENPICEMTHAAHMGRNAYMLVEYDIKTKETQIARSDLEKEEAKNLILKENQFLVANVLHFRSGDSLIDRSDFNSWRKAYWAYRAEQILESQKQLPKTEDLSKMTGASKSLTSSESKNVRVRLFKN